MKIEINSWGTMTIRPETEEDKNFIHYWGKWPSRIKLNHRVDKDTDGDLVKLWLIEERIDQVSLEDVKNWVKRETLVGEE